MMMEGMQRSTPFSGRAKPSVTFLRIHLNVKMMMGGARDDEKLTRCGLGVLPAAGMVFSRDSVRFDVLAAIRFV